MPDEVLLLTGVERHYAEAHIAFSYLLYGNVYALFLHSVSAHI